MRIRDYESLKEQGAGPREIYCIIREDAAALGGDLQDMAQRAAVYHHVYLQSGKNLIFPLIAAHGALWAVWYLKAAQLAAHVFSVLDVVSPLSRAGRMAAYNRYVNSFLAINKAVMVETYVIFHATRLSGSHEILAGHMPADLIAAFLDCHEARAQGRKWSADQQKSLYERYFRWEQEMVVGPLVEVAVNEFHWNFMKWFCVRPWIWFSYFRLGRGLIFKDFTDAEERVEKGVTAFGLAERKGWDRVEMNLLRNPLYPRAFKIEAEDMQTLRTPVLVPEQVQGFAESA